jgi:hypothetical protein
MAAFSQPRRSRTKLGGKRTGQAAQIVGKGAGLVLTCPPNLSVFRICCECRQCGLRPQHRDQVLEVGFGVGFSDATCAPFE